MVVLLSRNLRKQQDSMGSSLMCSLNLNTVQSVFWIDQPLSWKILLLLRKELKKKLLKGLNPSKALGPDELHPRVLKELATE